MAKQIKSVILVGDPGSGKTTFTYKLKRGDLIDEIYVESINSKGAISGGVWYKDTKYLEMEDLDDYHENTRKQEYMESASGIMLFIDSTDNEKLQNGEIKKYLDIISEISRNKANSKSSKKGWFDNIIKSENESNSNSLSKPFVKKEEIYSKYESKHVIPLCIFCNKQDLPYCISVKQIGIDLGLYQWFDYKKLFKSSKNFISYNCPDYVIDIITDYMGDKVIDPVNKEKAMFHLEGCCTSTGDGLYEGLDWLSSRMKGAKL